MTEGAPGDPAVVTVMLNRPERRNALTPPMLEFIEQQNLPARATETGNYAMAKLRAELADLDAGLREGRR